MSRLKTWRFRTAGTLLFRVQMNQFHLYEQIGSGAHSAVYKARRKKKILYVAAKSVDAVRHDEAPRILP